MHIISVPDLIISRPRDNICGQDIVIPGPETIKSDPDLAGYLWPKVIKSGSNLVTVGQR